MSVFDEQAINAARKWKRGRILSFDDAKDILRAAEASLRERGMLRDGTGISNTDGSWAADTRHAFGSDFQVAIIRIPPPPVQS